MADETIIQPTPVAPEEPKGLTRIEERITQLSEKFENEAKAKEKALQDVATAEKRAQFAEGYADFVVTHPSAKEFKAQIQEKAMAGMSVEDAGFAVLGKANKLGAAHTPEPQPVAGGSAATTPPQSGTKPVTDMTQDERRAELAKALAWT